MFLSDAFLSSIVAEVDSDDYVGILLGGSYARGEATEWSDVDIACFVSSDTKLRRKQFFYREGKLVSIGTKSIMGIREQLSKPETAIWVAHGIGDCRILLDKDGSVTALLDEVNAFTWEPLREAADRNASFWLLMAAELAQKVANELSKGDAGCLIRNRQVVRRPDPDCCNRTRRTNQERQHLLSPGGRSRRT